MLSSASDYFMSVSNSSPPLDQLGFAAGCRQSRGAHAVLPCPVVVS